MLVASPATPQTSRPKAASAAAIAPRVDSRVLAKHLGVRHQSTFELIKTYLTDFKEFGALWIETEKPKGPGQPEKYALLNEDQIKLLLAYSRNTEQARALKIRLIKNPALFVTRLKEELA